MTVVAELARRAASASPPELDELVDSLRGVPDLPAALAHAVADPSTAAGAGRLLRRLHAADVAPILLEHLHSSDVLVRDTAAVTLADLGVRGDAIAHELAEGIRRLPRPVADTSTARQLVDRSERLARVGALPDDVARQLAEVLRFMPSGPPRAAIWPSTWIRAARVLGLREPPSELREIADAGWPSYLSAVGALALARSGIRDESVDDWLQSTRDYYLLTAAERAEIEPLLAGLSDSALAELRAIDAAGT